MALFGSPSSDIEKGDDAIKQSYAEAAQYLNPYTKNAGTDFDNTRKGLYGAIGNLKSQGNPNTPFYQMLQHSPSDILNQAESGYEQSPFEQQQMQLGQSTLNNSLASQGLTGSGLGNAEMSGMTTAMNGADMQKYLGNLMHTFDKQLQVLGIDDKQRQGILGAFGKMVGMENHASGQMAGIAQKEGQEEGNLYGRQSMNDERKNRGLFGNITHTIGEGGKLGFDAWNTSKILAAAGLA